MTPTLPELRDAIANVVNYMWPSEEADYVREHEPEGHIFEDLRLLQASIRRD